MDRPTPRADQNTRPASAPRRRSYCRRDGWLCRPGNRCDEHRVERDPVQAFRFLKGGSFILDGEDVPFDE
jgi:hypothetical protein